MKPLANEDYERCKYSITCSTDDPVIVHCLRAICHFAEVDVKPQIAWGGTKMKDWVRAGNQITLHFTSPHHRERFVREASRVLPEHSWRESGRSDNDPAKRQR
jgi:hypothetical protein